MQAIHPRKMENAVSSNLWTGMQGGVGEGIAWKRAELVEDVPSGSPYAHCFAAEIMEPCPVAIPDKLTILDAVSLLRDTGVSNAPVVDERGRLVGRVTLDDLRRRVAHDGEHPVVEATAPPVWAVEDDSLIYLVGLMVTHRVEQVPIVRAQKIRGIVTRQTILDAIARLTR